MLVAAVVLAQVGAAAYFLLSGPWVCGLLFAAAAACSLLIVSLVVTSAQMRRAFGPGEPPAQAYSESEYVGW